MLVFLSFLPSFNDKVTPELIDYLRYSFTYRNDSATSLAALAFALEGNNI